MRDYYVGLMSGTSMDGIDAVLVSFAEADVEIHATHTETYPQDLKAALFEAIRAPLNTELDRSGELSRRVGESFRNAALAVTEKSSINLRNIVAIGSHGQTLRHQPDAPEPFSLQIGDADIIAAGTNTITVANFREADIAAGGQGAPLVPPFHQWLFQSAHHDRVVINVGGMANITILPANGSDISGFDTGPGNGLMDAWIRMHRDQPFDCGGEWAASGTVSNSLLEQLLDDEYFERRPPKSSGFEHFNIAWLQGFEVDALAPADVQTTLCELSASTIAGAVLQHAASSEEVYICGGGVLNSELMGRISIKLPGKKVSSTAAVGLDPEWVEAVAFAWLAMRTLQGQTGNLPSVTGASHKVMLGDIHSP